MAELSQDQLRELCAALGWQGGTYWQVLAEVKRLKAVTTDGYRTSADGLTRTKIAPDAAGRLEPAAGVTPREQPKQEKP